MKSSLNIKAIIHALSRLVAIEALIMIAPLTVCIIYGENDWKAFAAASATALAVAVPGILFTRNENNVIRSREGFVITAAIWIVYGFFGLIPFTLCANPISFTDAMFETVSGFTTTGVSAITDVESHSHGILFWRAMTQWIGGLGIILFLLALLPELNKSAGLSMFNAETTGIVHTKLHPRIRQTALALWTLYGIITLISTLLLWLGPMNLFDSICQSFTAIATGGFSTRNAGVSYWNSNYVLAVLSVVMLVGGINFMVLYAAFKHGLKQLVRNEVTRIVVATVIVAYALITLSLIIQDVNPDIDNYFFLPLFHVISAFTSTGFSIPQFESWGSFSLLLTLLLMLCGACAGSTSGGIKIDRFIILNRNIANEIKKTVYPKRVYVVNLNGSFLQSDMMPRVAAFIALYLLITLAVTGIITLFGYPLTDSFFMSSSCIGCNGLGYGATGVNGSYAGLPCGVKWVLSLEMLIGRLELLTFIVLFMPSFWKK